MLLKNWVHLRLWLLAGLMLMLLVLPQQPPVLANDCTTTSSGSCTG